MTKHPEELSKIISNKSILKAPKNRQNCLKLDIEDIY